MPDDINMIYYIAHISGIVKVVLLFMAASVAAVFIVLWDIEDGMNMHGLPYTPKRLTRAKKLFFAFFLAAIFIPTESVVLSVLGVAQ
ncbi:MAG: hypothetical protein ABJG15_13250 [Hyphomonadaceae bacterium]